MEARQLAYFVFACQHRNHTEAAKDLQIPASVLSDNLRLLEKELDTTLFQRGPRGLYPTEAARWLYQSIEPVLRSLEDGEEVLKERGFTASRMLEVTSPLRFLMGRLSRATSLAARELRKTDPDVLVKIDFAATIGAYRDGEDVSAEPGERFEKPSSLAGRVQITHGYEAADPKSVLLLEDRWLCVAPIDRVMNVGQMTDFDSLRRGRLYIPALRAPQIRRLRDYCAQHKLPEPLIFDDDIGTLPRLTLLAEPYHLLVPEAMIADSLARLNLGYTVLPEEIKSPIIATASIDSPTARRYVDFLKAAVQSDKPILRYEPGMTLKQVKYFLAVCRELSISAAARQLDVAQPAVSAQIKKLEGVSSEELFVRHRGGLKMTQRAEALQRVLAPTSAAVEEVIREAPYVVAARMRQLTLGVIPMSSHLGALEISLSDALKDWQGSHPKLRLRLMEAPKQVLYRWVEAGRISVALVEAEVDQRRHPDTGKLCRLGVITADGSAASGDMQFTEAAKLPLVLPDDTYGLRQLLQKTAAEAHFRLEPQAEVNSLPITLDMVKRRGMATILPHYVIKPYLADGSFQFRPLSMPALASRLTFLHSASRELTETEKALIATIRSHLRFAELACD